MFFSFQNNVKEVIVYGSLQDMHFVIIDFLCCSHCSKTNEIKVEVDVEEDVDVDVDVEVENKGKCNICNMHSYETTPHIRK